LANRREICIEHECNGGILGIPAKDRGLAGELAQQAVVFHAENVTGFRKAGSERFQAVAEKWGGHEQQCSFREI
jgi:hypothetical protein